MKQVRFRQKKIVQPHQSIQKTLIEAKRAKRRETFGQVKETRQGKKRLKKSKAH